MRAERGCGARSTNGSRHKEPGDARAEQEDARLPPGEAPHVIAHGLQAAVTDPRRHAFQRAGELAGEVGHRARLTAVGHRSELAARSAQPVTGATRACCSACS